MLKFAFVSYCKRNGVPISKVAYEAVDRVEQQLRGSNDTPDKFVPERKNVRARSGVGSMERRTAGTSRIGKTPLTNIDGRPSNLSDLFNTHDQNVRLMTHTYPIMSRFFTTKRAEEEQYALMLSPEAKTAGLMDWLARGAVRAGEGLAGWAGRGGTLAQRYAAGAEAAGAGGAGSIGKAFRGISDVFTKSKPVTALEYATNPMRNYMGVIGPDRFSALFNVMAGLEGARRGKEVGGAGGAIAGGLAGFGGSRAGFGLAEVIRKGLVKKVSEQIARGKLTSLASKAGRGRGWLGNQLERAGTALEKSPGSLTGEGKMLNRIVTSLRAPQARLQAGQGFKIPGTNITTAMGDNLMPAVSLAASIPIMGVAYGVGTSVGDKINTSAFNAYKRMSQGMHDEQQLQGARQNMMRRMSPELRASGYNPYRNV